MSSKKFVCWKFGKSRGKLLQIILAGQPELDRKLDAPTCGS